MASAPDPPFTAALAREGLRRSLNLAVEVGVLPVNDAVAELAATDAALAFDSAPTTAPIRRGDATMCAACTAIRFHERNYDALCRECSLDRLLDPVHSHCWTCHDVQGAARNLAKRCSACIRLDLIRHPVDCENCRAAHFRHSTTTALCSECSLARAQDDEEAVL